MFEVTKNETHVVVSVKLKKRVMAKEAKVYLYSHDALTAAKEEMPGVELVEKAEKDIVISNVSGPYEGTWKFPLKLLPKPVEVKPEESKEEKKQLKIETRRARLEKLKAKNNDSSSEE